MPRTVRWTHYDKIHSYDMALPCPALKLVVQSGETIVPRNSYRVGLTHPREVLAPYLA